MFPQIEGEIDSFDVIVIGHQRANVFFGESLQNPPRPRPVCTTTLIRGVQTDGTPYALLVDPAALSPLDAIHHELWRRTGLSPDAITHCFCTHEHFDHIEGLNAFPGARWLIARENMPFASASLLADKTRFIPVEGEFLPGVAAVRLPGHTMTQHGAAFRYHGFNVLCAGDAVPSRHHLPALKNNYEDDAALAAEMQKYIAQTYHVVIPGHGNVFLV